jgi:tRNA U34 5-methylaminomethyl-2-thiouridine-forming methyltransferase MnmC
LQRKIITTADGSKTIQIEDWNEQYHSVHGAIQEANHVYIKHGLLFFYDEFLSASQPIHPSRFKSDLKHISILEIGFGTGLNAILTLLASEGLNLQVDYCGVEAFPISDAELNALNYPDTLGIKNHTLQAMHDCDWEFFQQITDNFNLLKQRKNFMDIEDVNSHDIVYFDAFGARVQPELWTEPIFEKMYAALKPNGVLVTYACKGSVKRALKSIGFTIERLEGPPGKRHMLRAIKR